MAILINLVSVIVLYFICSSLGDEIQLTLDDEALKSLDLHPLIREERQYNHGGMMNMPYSGQPGMMNNGQEFYGQPGMYPMGSNAGYYGNMQQFHHQRGFNQGMRPGGTGGLYNSLLNPLNLMSNMMGSGRSAQHFQKEMIPPLTTDPIVHDDHIVDHAPHYASNMYPGGCSCMRASYRSSEPVASYILSAPHRRQTWLL